MVMLLEGKILINLTNKRILSLCLLLFAGCANAATDKPPLECAVSAIGEKTIAKVHYKQRSFFIVRNKERGRNNFPKIVRLNGSNTP